MGLMLLQLACVALVMLRHGTDAQMTGFSRPTATGAVTVGITAGDLSTTATVVIVDGTAGGLDVVTAVGAGTGNITYALTDVDMKLFATTRGDVMTKAAHTVDYATKPSYTLTITATDDADSAATTATLVLTVTVNDLPTFTSPTMCWEIASDAAVGTTVGTYAASAGTVGTAITTYSITAGDTNVDFSDSLTNGVLVTAKTPLGSATYTLVIQAVDDGAAPATGSISVTIRRMADGTTLQECPNGVSGLVGSLIVLITAMTAKFM